MIKTPVLSKPLTGEVYVGEQKSSDPASGEEFRILFEAKALDLGVVVRLIGNVSANPVTGQLTATFDEQQVNSIWGDLPEGLPQAPFEAVTLTFNGSHQVLTTPPTCSVSTTTSIEEPWSTPASTTQPSDSFTLSSEPGGGTCPTTLGARRFTPTYTAKSSNTQGGAYSPFAVHLGRTDGQQEVKQVDVTLPPGHAAKSRRRPLLLGGRPGGRRGQERQGRAGLAQLLRARARSAPRRPSPEPAPTRRNWPGRPTWPAPTRALRSRWRSSRRRSRARSTSARSSSASPSTSIRKRPRCTPSPT